MGTLTGDLPVLEAHCSHKLPSSCRLSAYKNGRLECCACQDIRPHSVSGFYSVYIDGVGLVSRGTRWQRYCFFCKEFWQNRLAATDPPMESNQTRIPEVPDQTEFTEKWFDYHRGYRIVRDGEEEKRIEMKLEIPWRDVDPGTLPLKDHAQRSVTIRHAPSTQARQEPTVSIESALDALFEDTDDNPPVPNGHIQPVQQPPPARPRQGLTEADITAAQHAKDRLEDADRVLAEVETLHQRLTQELATAESQLRDRTEERRVALREHRAAQQLVRVLGTQGGGTERDAQRMARVWGTRDEIVRQGANYISPITDMFTRAYDRYRIAEEVRAEERASDDVTERQQRLIASLGPWYNGAGISDADYSAELDAPRELQSGPPQTLDDAEANRPPPKSDEEMMVRLACKICLQQPADIAALPCGHMVSCNYCADVYMPVKNGDQTRLVRRDVTCPLPYCRKTVTRRVKIYIS